MNTTTLKALLLVGAIGGTPFTALAETPATGDPVCDALVQVANDLYLVDSDGASLARFTSDGLPKHSASLAPDGSMVAFIPDAAPSTFTVADSKGGSNSYPADKLDKHHKSRAARGASDATGGTFVGVAWATRDIVRLDWHVSPSSDRFEFYRVPRDLPSWLREAAGSSVGAVCAIASREDDVACIQGNDIVVDGKVVYSDSGFTGAPQQDSLTLPVGGSASVQGIPGLEVEVVSIASGITLRVTLPTGNWTESRVDPGDFLPVQLADQTLGFFPTVTDATNGIVKIVVLSSTTGQNVFNRAIAWRLRDRGIAVVQNSGAGPALTLLTPKGRSGWGVLGQAPMGVQAPVESMRFVTPRLLYFETQAQFGIVPAAIVRSSSGPVLQVGAIATLASSLTVNVTGTPISTPALTWACRPPDHYRRP